MLPLQQAYEAKASVLEYLKATFGFRDRELREAFNHFIENPQEGLFKGPYISLNLPFEKAKENSSSQHLDILPSFSPFIHQVESFKRLSNKNNNNPLPTLLTTGTGSGKTEAFLYPLLDYCYQNRRRKGIKAIILYPMNALATDQAQRIAETIYNDPRLKDDVTAGLLIGTGTQKHHYPTFMGDKHVIENRQTIIDYPPDILLTNFKMLDYALMRHNFHNLWNYNLQDNTLLKYLVLDELHTYDGAQGTDVANLIRRLKLKLKIPDKQICPVGTSATLGTGKDSKNLLANYASDVFGEKITEDAVIEEKRVNVDEFFNIEGSEDFLPRGAAIKKAKIGINENYNNYIQKQKKLWQISEEVDDIELSEELKSFRLIKDISDVTSNRIYHINELTNKIAERNKKFSAYKKDEQLSLIESALALLSQAKSKSGDKVSPLINMQVQYWMRELSGILRKVSEKPEFTFRAEQTNEENAALPAWFCRECGASGWVAAMNERDEEIETDIQKVYNYYFSNHKNVYLINTDKEENRNIEEYNPTDTLKETPYLNVENLKLNNRSNDKSIPIIGYHKVSNNRNIYDCPNCNTSNTINIIGTRIATLASVTTSQVLSSDLDPTKDANRKILSFTNGVQDAAHKSGFIQSRNYRFTFRTALQNVINQQDRPVNIQELHDAFTKYWKENASEEKNSKLEAYYSKFFPSDHLDVQISFDQDFEEEFDRRILWQITSEFGYNAIIGRTLEKTGSSGTYFVNDKIEQVYEKMQEWLDENTLGHISKEDFSKFLVAFLHRLRRRGGIDHPYLLNFRTQSSSYFQITQKTNPHYFLIKNFGKSTRLPKLLSDTNLNVYDSTTRKKALIWSHEYFIKNFPLAQNQIELINDFYKELLNKLAEVNVLDEKETSKARNFALNPVEVYVGKEPVIYECKKCGHRLTTTREANGILQSAKCINYRCKGEYEEIKMGDDFNYYRQVYNRQRTPRIYAADHTGLLERRKREEIESSFKKRQSFRDYNVLVATSTLEMGIDIGDLNIAMNMDVPPQPANYLQRIGRAGRKSGNAFIMNFSGNEAHDLFYYEEPSEMMEGDIHTP
ncbi:MAG: DEAD/DEAH box helicase, partial [bacterium]